MRDILTRRNVLIGAGGVVIVAGAAFEAGRLWRKRHAPSPYDDLLARLDDRDADAKIGEAVLAETTEFDAKAVAAGLRTRLDRVTLAQAVAKDAAEGRLLEAHGWVVPETIGLLCALAVKAA